MASWMKKWYWYITISMQKDHRGNLFINTIKPIIKVEKSIKGILYWFQWSIRSIRPNALLPSKTIYQVKRYTKKTMYLGGDVQVEVRQLASLLRFFPGDGNLQSPYLHRLHALARRVRGRWRVHLCKWKKHENGVKTALTVVWISSHIHERLFHAVKYKTTKKRNNLRPIYK